MLTGNMALTLHGITRIPADLDLLVDPEGDNIPRFLEILGSEGVNQEEAAVPAQHKDREICTSRYLRTWEKSGQQIRVHIKTPVPFGEAFERSIIIPLGSLAVDLMCLEDLILFKSGTDD